MRRKSARQIRAERRETIAISIFLVGLFLLAAGGLCLQYEMQDGLDHTKHLCHVWSYIAVMGSFAGCILTGFAGFFLICGDDA